MSKLVFSLRRKETEVEIEGVSYILRELTGLQRDTYLDEVGERINYNAEGKAQGMRHSGLQSLLISMSLYTTDGKLVEASVVKEWPASVQAGLFDEAQKLSGLVTAPKAPEKKAEVKNE